MAKTSPAANENVATKVVTGTVRLSYVQVWEPKAMEEGDKPKYSVAILIPKTDKKTIAEIYDAIEAAAKVAGKSKFGGMVPASLKIPLRDGDEERPDQEAYEGHYFMNASSSSRPGIVDKNIKPILDQDEVYSGCYARVSVNFYAFNTRGNKGIACGLNHIMKLKDGEPLGGRSTAESDFESADLEDDDLLS